MPEWDLIKLTAIIPFPHGFGLLLVFTLRDTDDDEIGKIEIPIPAPSTARTDSIIAEGCRQLAAKLDEQATAMRALAESYGSR